MKLYDIFLVSRLFLNKCEYCYNQIKESKLMSLEIYSSLFFVSLIQYIRNKPQDNKGRIPWILFKANI